MNSASTKLDSFPGRITMRVVVPDALLDIAERLATEAGTDPALVLGNLAAAALPGALYDTALDVLKLPCPNAATPPTMSTAHRGEPSLNAGVILPGDGGDPEPGSNGTTA